MDRRGGYCRRFLERRTKGHSQGVKCEVEGQPCWIDVERAGIDPGHKCLVDGGRCGGDRDGDASGDRGASGSGGSRDGTVSDRAGGGGGGGCG